MTDEAPQKEPCPHAFPYTVTGTGDIHYEPCERCSTPWERRDDDYPNHLVTWSMPPEARFGPPPPPATFLPAQKPEPNPDWSIFDKERP